jgi:hypothetical protein
VGAVDEWRLVGYQQLAEHVDPIEQPELWHLDERLERHVAQHDRPIELERRHERQRVGHEHIAEHFEQPER